MRLYVMTVSHFCERARWGLDRAGLAYEERAWAPLLHVPLARRIAEATALPILATGAGTVQGSGAILTWAGLVGGEAALERRFETVIGPLVRQYVYAGALHDPRSGVREALLAGVPPVQAALARAGWPLIRRAMAVGMALGPDRLPELAGRLDAELDWVDALVAGDGALARAGFGRDAITAASLLAPLARPDALPLYRRVRLPPEVEDALARWGRRPAQRWTLETYARHRR